ncbi:MAG: hypothetical protein H6732_11295 [Alphaproteobacteria bacterium]|nr:hypothetical protein [Alphaproteobacteria bacterium]
MRTLAALFTVGVLSLAATPAEARPGPTHHAHPGYGHVLATGVLVLRNDGDRPLRLSFDRRYGADPADLWLPPGAVQHLSVPAGDLSVSASIQGRRGLRVVQADAVRITPGSRTVRSFGWYAPDPISPVQFTNTARRPVEVLVDGRVIAWVEPGQTTSFVVDAGRHALRVQAGRFVVYDQLTVFHDGMTLGAVVAPGGTLGISWTRATPSWSGRVAYPVPSPRPPPAVRVHAPYPAPPPVARGPVPGRTPPPARPTGRGYGGRNGR